MAGTGPYVLVSVGKTTNDIVLQANPNYWGGPYPTKLTPTIQTVNINYVPDEATREIDLRSAASSSQPMTVDILTDHLYDVAERSAWLNNRTLQSTIPGVSLYGPFSAFTTLFDPFGMNVTNPFTGKLYTFQPFADRRLRLAFADAVNMTTINRDINNNMGQVATSVITPGLPPAGSFNPNNLPAYSYNLDAAQNLLLDAMEHPLTSFNFVNGTAAPPGYFNNSFGCSPLPASGTCTNPIPRTITLVAATGDTVDLDIMNTIAGNVNNVSQTYNMGLTVSVEPLPSGTELTEALSGNLYFYSFGWIDDYPWALDFTYAMYAPYATYTGPDGWNIPAMGRLYKDSVNASSAGDLSRIVSDTDEMNTLANEAVMYLWTFYPLAFMDFTSNVSGFYWNPQWGPNGAYFVVLSITPTTMTSTSTSAAAAPSSTLMVAAVAIVIVVIVAIAAIVARGRKKTKT
jgi:hypothetical protein